MGANTAISWCDASWSPWHGCQKISEGCKNCYADALSLRYGKRIWGPASTTQRQMMSEAHWRKPLAWNRKCERTNTRMTVFPSMCDPFEDNPQLVDVRRRFWSLIHETPNLTWLLLTKRPQNIFKVFDEEAPEWIDHLPDNMWIGASVENQDNVWRAEILTEAMPKGNYFLSLEPLIGPVDIEEYLYIDYDLPGHYLPTGDPELFEWQPFRWVIVGGESGNGHRPMEMEWVRDIHQQCSDIEAFFFKQSNGSRPGMNPLLDGKLIQQFPKGLEPREVMVAK